MNGFTGFVTTGSRRLVTKYSDLFEVVHPSPDLVLERNARGRGLFIWWRVPLGLRVGCCMFEVANQEPVRYIYVNPCDDCQFKYDRWKFANSTES